jgi:hypothetical protein
MYEALHQRIMRTEVITGETNSPYGTNTKNANFPAQSTLDGVVFFFVSYLDSIVFLSTYNPQN